MTEFFAICSVLALCSAALMILSGREKELVVLISSLIYVVAIVYVLSKVSSLIKVSSTFFDKANEVLPIKYIMQAGGAAVFGTVTSSVCEDVGQKGVARAVETLTVMEMILIFAPIGKKLFENLLDAFFA